MTMEIKKHSYLSRRFKVAVKRVLYLEESNTCHAEIYKGEELVGKVLSNAYNTDVIGVDIRMRKNDPNDKRAYFYPDGELSLEDQIQDAITNIGFVIGKNDDYFTSIP